MPKFSIITVNYNDVEGLQKTVESVLHQSFIDFEYIIVDGASNDGSVAYIEKVKPFITHFISEKDKGVYEAMNKGLRLAKGDYVLFLNSGDFFIDESLLQRASLKIAGTKALYYGDLIFCSAKEEFLRTYPQKLEFSYFLERSLPHPGTFIKRTLFDELFYYSEHFKIISDWEFFIYAICKANVSYQHIDETISVFNLKGMSNDPKNKAIIEAEKAVVYQKYFEEEHRLALVNRKDNKQLDRKNSFFKMEKILQFVFSKRG
ncbi:MAG: glycosyltransferase family 2 protein [Flavobacteriaceae bacterium]